MADASYRRDSCGDVCVDPAREAGKSWQNRIGAPNQANWSVLEGVSGQTSARAGRVWGDSIESEVRLEERHRIVGPSWRAFSKDVPSRRASIRDGEGFLGPRASPL